jgi:hypothetical protein
LFGERKRVSPEREYWVIQSATQPSWHFCCAASNRLSLIISKHEPQSRRKGGIGSGDGREPIRGSAELPDDRRRRVDYVEPARQ